MTTFLAFNSPDECVTALLATSIIYGIFYLFSGYILYNSLIGKRLETKANVVRYIEEEDSDGNPYYHLEVETESPYLPGARILLKCFDQFYEHPKTKYPIGKEIDVTLMVRKKTTAFLKRRNTIWLGLILFGFVLLHHVFMLAAIIKDCGKLQHL